jgi:hypothetical protein
MRGKDKYALRAHIYWDIYCLQPVRVRGADTFF